MTKQDRIRASYGGPIFSHGNTKLPTSTAIFNMGPASNGAKGNAFRMLCPEYAAGTCQLSNPAAECYAVKAERQYEDTRSMRNRSGSFWAMCAPTEFVEAFLIHRTRNTRALRFNESGGIGSESEARRLVEICHLLAMHAPDVEVYIYTSRRDIWVDYLQHTAPSNLTVNGSGFMAHNAFHASYEAHDVVKAFRAAGGKSTICGMDCTRCRVCVTRHNVDTVAELH